VLAAAAADTGFTCVLVLVLVLAVAGLLSCETALTEPSTTELFFGALEVVVLLTLLVGFTSFFKLGTVNNEPQPVTKYCCTAWKIEETVQ
jgi:hypothetical protein